MSTKKTKTKAKTKPKANDPASNEALQALDVSYASSPDMPMAVAVKEFRSLSRTAASRKPTLAKIGITAEKISLLGTYAKRLDALEATWRRARKGVRFTDAERKLLGEAEKLDSKLLAGGRWACRKDADAQEELTRIAEGSGAADTVQDLRDLVTFWDEHKDALKFTTITDKDLKRAGVLAGELDDAAAKEESDLDAATALELRNRCFWAADELAKEIREGGRYAFADEPKTAVKFVSRYRATAARRSRKNAKARAEAEAANEAEDEVEIEDEADEEVAAPAKPAAPAKAKAKGKSKGNAAPVEE